MKVSSSKVQRAERYKGPLKSLSRISSGWKSGRRDLCDVDVCDLFLCLFFFVVDSLIAAEVFFASKINH